MLLSLIRDLLKSRKTVGQSVELQADDSPAFLNVGGGSKKISVPGYFAGWRHVLLDIDARGDVDLVCDARELQYFDAARYDAVYCSHNLEHYYSHDVIKVLQGFLHVLKDDGFAEIAVPDVGALLEYIVKQRIGLDDVLYESPAGPISAHDVLWGLGREIEESGHDYYAHKTGFTEQTLVAVLTQAGFACVIFLPTAVDFELRVAAFKQQPRQEQLAFLGVERVST